MTMTKINVTAPKRSGTKREISLEYDFGANLAEAMKKFDHGVIHSLFIDAAVIQRAGQVRPTLGIKKGADGYKTDETIRAETKTWKPKIGRQADPVKKRARFVRTFETMTEAERAEALALLTKAAGGPIKPVLVKKRA